MPLRPIAAVVEDALRAAQAIHRLASDHRARSGLHVSDLVRLSNELQRQFEAVKAILAYQPAEVQATASSLYGSRAPADALAMIGAGQQAGAAVVTSIVAHELSPAGTPAYTWHEASATFVERGLTGAEISWLHESLDGLIAALAPIAV